MKSVRAKFKVVEIGATQYGSDAQERIKLAPVTANSEENKRFFKWTPGGSIDLQVVNSGMFTLGSEYYVDFTPTTAE